MKIFVMAEGICWKVEEEAYSPFWKDMIVIREYPGKREYPSDIAVLDYREDMFHGLGSDSAAGYKSRFYRALVKHAGEIGDMIAEGEDVVVLGDLEPESLLIVRILQNLGKRIDLHLWVVLPFVFEGKQKKKRFEELLADTHGIKSILAYHADRALEMVGMEGEGLLEAYAHVEYRVKQMFPSYLEKIRELGEKTYFYDFRYDRFFETEESFFGWRNERNALNPIPKKEEKETLSAGKGDISEVRRIYPRADGHEVCQTLKKLRVEFAEANDILFKTERCTYKGPCAGTCAACDRELEYLENCIRERQDGTLFPAHELGETEISIAVRYDPQYRM